MRPKVLGNKEVHTLDRKTGARSIGYFTFRSRIELRQQKMQDRCKEERALQVITGGQQVYEFVLDLGGYDSVKPKPIKQSLYKCFPKPGPCDRGKPRVANAPNFERNQKSEDRLARVA